MSRAADMTGVKPYDASEFEKNVIITLSYFPTSCTPQIFSLNDLQKAADIVHWNPVITSTEQYVLFYAIY